MLDELINGYDEDTFCRFLNIKFSGSFSASRSPVTLTEQQPWQCAERLGVVKTLTGPNGANMPLLVVSAKLHDGGTLKERSSRLKQFKFAKQALDQAMSNPSPDIEGVVTQGLFVFYDEHGNFRLSLVYGRAEGMKLVWSTARRLSFHVQAGDGNKTFRDRMALPWSSFDKLKEAFSVEKLTREFYGRLFAWYQWALSDELNVTYPNDIERNDDDREINDHIIRLITRLMFVWFLKQKHLVPDNLFDPAALKNILKNFNPMTGDNYYRAILQNLFFATLNSEIAERAFAVDAGNIKDNREHFDIKTLYRYGADFSLTPEQVLKLFSSIPFLNGGLFECLDRGRNYSDGFSREPKNQTRIPNRLFFDPDKGLIPLLQQYNFTVEENSPGDEEVALDPELLGKVFENLLGAYNPETNVAARNATGSFYTPREIVNYMVDESLIAHLTVKCGEENADAIRKLFTGGERPANKSLCDAMDTALVTAKILDPACGSGAFPMGILLRMVELLRILRNIPEDQRVYDLKLELIENCIYGGDIQCIAVQISKLRFFISLVCEQKPTNNPKENYGIHTLPNLETKFVAADSLIGLPKSGDELPMRNVEALKKELWQVRHKHFLARTYQEKKDLRKEDKILRERLAKELEHGGGFDTASAKLMAAWDPYDQNTSATFSDPEWMFNVKDGFDVVIGNPPYIDSETMVLLMPEKRDRYREIYELTGNWDIYMAFFMNANVASKMVYCFITPDKWLSRPFGEKFRKTVIAKKLSRLVHCGSGVFENVTVDALVTLCVNNAHDARFYKYGQSKEVCEVFACSLGALKEPYFLDYFFTSHFRIIMKLENSRTCLSEYWTCENACALVPFVEAGSINVSKNRYFKLVNTGTISKFFTRWGQQPITYLRKELGCKPLCPIVQKDKFSLNLGKTYLRRAVSKKLISKGLNLLDVCLDLEGEYLPGKSTLVICDESEGKLKTLCALLNSNLAFYYFKNKFASCSYCGGVSFTPDMVNSFPIVSGDEDLVLSEHVDKILSRGHLLEIDMDKINGRVYELYGLTPEEIAIVEDSVSHGRAAAVAEGNTDIPVCVDSPQAGMPVLPSKPPKKRKTVLPPSLPGWD